MVQYTNQPIIPPKKRKAVKIFLGVAALGVVVIIGGAVSGGDDTSSGGSKSSNVATAPTGKPKREPKELTPAQEFKAFVDQAGTPQEYAAVKHVTKVQGSDEQNDVLDAAEVYTDFTGGMMGPHANDGKLIASAFADWKDSKNGLVTVYDKSGEILSNGNF